MNQNVKRPMLLKREKAVSGQCPGCSSFNYPDYLPASKKSFGQNGWQVNCALCGHQYSIPQAIPQAA
jgi:hypothetical protein